MPDENQNPVGIVQTPTDQSGDDNDFVLDFGDEGLEQVKDEQERSDFQVDENNDVEDKSHDMEDDMNINLDQGNLTEDEENREQQVDIQDLDSKEDEESVNNEFDISLNEEDYDENSKDNLELVHNEQNEIEDLGLENEEINDDIAQLSEDETESDNIGNGENYEDIEHDENIYDSEQENEQEYNKESNLVNEELGSEEDSGNFMDNEQKKEDNQEGSIEDNQGDNEESNYEYALDDNISEDDEERSNFKENKEESEFNINLDEGNVNIEETEDDSNKNADFQGSALEVNEGNENKDYDENNEENQETDTILENNQETDTSTDNVQTDEELSNDSVSENVLKEQESENEYLGESTEKEQNFIEEKESEKSDFTMDVNINEEQQIKQPEISDLLGNEVVDFSSEDTLNSVDEEILPENSESENNFNTGNSSNLNDSIEDDSHENSDLIGGSNEVSNDKLTTDDEIVLYNEKSENNEKSNLENTVDVGDKAKNSQDVVSPTLSTLSLDQILDSELSTNPQFADNSKAEPKNVKKTSGLLANKKLVGIISGILIFLLAGFVAVMAFPSKTSERKAGDVEIDTGTIMEEGDHGSGSESQEYAGGDDADMEGISGEETPNPTTAGSTVQLFPDADEGDSSEDIEQIEPQPYVCINGDCGEESEQVEISSENFKAEDIMQIITDFKTQAESYYLLGDDMQDKKLVRYAAQAINLCDTYQAEIESGEGLNQESLEEFKTKVKPLISKMEEYLGGTSEVETFTKSNFYEEYDFEGKDELKEYINNRANGLY